MAHALWRRVAVLAVLAVLAALAATAVSALAPYAGAQPASVLTDVRAALARCVEAWNRHDPPAFGNACLTEDVLDPQPVRLTLDDR